MLVLLFLVVFVVALALMSAHVNCLLFSSGDDDACLQRPHRGSSGARVSRWEREMTKMKRSNSKI